MGDRVPPPRWLKSANKLVMVLLRLGLPISRHESPVVLTVPVLREFPAQVPVGVDMMKRTGIVELGTPDELEGLAGRLAVFRVEAIT